MSVQHRESHRDLLAEFHAGDLRTVDMLVVPAGRTTPHLKPAAALAHRLGCGLLVMCSDGADPDEFSAMAAADWPGLRWRTLRVPEDYEHALLPPTASPSAVARSAHHGRLSTKRNLGLLLARMVGWRTLLMLDDDIIGVGPRLVRKAASGLSTAGAVGLRVDDQADHSVVCHANRIESMHQEVFVTASALVADTSRALDFFPNIYNEDWLFLHQLLADRAVSRLPSAMQIFEDPFADPNRAAAQELGDVIAEGLVGALHDGPDLDEVCTDEFWQDFLDERARFIDRAATRITHAEEWRAEHRAAVASLAAAERRRGELTAQECAEFVSAWRLDRVNWRLQWRDLDRQVQIDAAVDRLGLSGSLIAS